MATYASNIPQPKSFAPSREDVLNTLAFFFGAPVSPEKLKDYSEHRKPILILFIEHCARPCA